MVTPGNTAVNGDVMDDLAVEQLRQRADSLRENIGALRFSVARIELLDGYRLLCRDLLADCRIPLAAYGQRDLVKSIDKLLKDTNSSEFTVQTP